MPELPEVETIARGLNKKLKNRKITGLWTDWPKYFRLPSGEALFKKHIIGKRITGVSRRAKNLFVHLSDNHLLLVHQKMSGHLMIGRWRPQKKNEIKTGPWAGQKWFPQPASGPLMDPMNRFIRLIFFLDNGRMLALSDLRRFAKALCGSKETILNLPEIRNLGPEPLNPKFGYREFRKLFVGKKGRLKQVLMNPNFIAGIGNIYADEILWFSRVHPLRRIEDLKKKDLKAVFRSMKGILKKALRLRGTSIDDYRDAEGKKGGYSPVRYIYQREGEPCRRCGVKIKRIKIAGRSAHFCPACQSLRR